MKFKKGDKVQFIRKGSLMKGIIQEIQTSHYGASYIVASDYDKPRWIDEGRLIPLSPLPVIPQFVADWISEHKAFERDLLSTLDIENPAMPKSVFRWLCDNAENQELFACAWLDGYEVEQEPLYYVRFLDGGLGFLNVYFNGVRLLNCHLGSEGYKTKFTESEIKELDERYWAFKVPVEEVEETK